MPARLCHIQDDRAMSDAAPDTVPLGPTVEGAPAEDLTATAWILWSNCSRVLHQHLGISQLSNARQLILLGVHQAYSSCWKWGLGVVDACVVDSRCWGFTTVLPDPRQEHISSWSARARGRRPDPRGLAGPPSRARAGLRCTSRGVATGPQRPRARGSTVIGSIRRRGYMLGKGWDAPRHRPACVVVCATAGAMELGERPPALTRLSACGVARGMQYSPSAWPGPCICGAPRGMQYSFECTAEPVHGVRASARSYTGARASAQCETSFARRALCFRKGVLPRRRRRCASFCAAHTIPTWNAAKGIRYEDAFAPAL